MFLNINLNGEIEKTEFINKIIKINNKIKIIIFIKNKNKKTINKICAIDNIEYYSLKNMNIEKITEILQKNEEIIFEDIGKEAKGQNNRKEKTVYITQRNTSEILSKEFLKLKKLLIKKSDTSKILLKNFIKKILLSKSSYLKNNKKNKIIKNYLKNNKKNKTINNYCKNNKKYIIINNMHIKKNIKNKIITISGTPGVGKSIFIVNVIYLINNKKILIIDFDYSINTILNIKNNSEEKYQIIKYKKNIDILNLKNTKINLNIINNIFKYYEIIFIDLTNNIEINKNFINNNYLNLILLEPNLLEINKINLLLKEYNNLLNNNFKKINIILNKYDKNCIKLDLLKIIFYKYKIIGTINYDNNYNKIINKKIFNIQKDNMENIKNIISKLNL